MLYLPTGKLRGICITLTKDCPHSALEPTVTQIKPMACKQLLKLRELSKLISIYGCIAYNTQTITTSDTIPTREQVNSLSITITNKSI